MGSPKTLLIKRHFGIFCLFVCLVVCFLETIHSGTHCYFLALYSGVIPGDAQGMVCGTGYETVVSHIKGNHLTPCTISLTFPKRHYRICLLYLPSSDIDDKLKFQLQFNAKYGPKFLIPQQIIF